MKIVLSVILGFMFVCCLNMGLVGASQFRLLSSDGANFIIAKLEKNGILSKTLADYCKEKKWSMCRYSDQLESLRGKDPAFLLWSYKAPLRRYRLLIDHQEINEITLYALKTYPLDMVEDGIKDTMKMMTNFKFKKNLYFKKIPVPGSRFKRNPRDIHSYYNTRQYKKISLPAKPLPLNDGLLALISFIGAVIFSLFHLYQKNYRFMWILWGCLLYILANDLITGSLSAADPRYQIRIIWLLPHLLIITNLEYLSKTINFSRDP